MSTATLLEHRPARTMPAPATDDFVEPDFLYEVLNGQIVEIEPMSIYSARVATNLCFALQSHALPAELGEVVVEGLFVVPRPGDRARKRRPDLAFVSAERWAIGRPQSIKVNAWDVIPDLAVEVISPTNSFSEVARKVKEYFAAGVRLVWVVVPEVAQVQVYESASASRVLEVDQELDGGIVLPEFRLPLARIFPPAGPDED